MVRGAIRRRLQIIRLAVLPDGRLALLDFGMVAEYDADERSAFRRLMQHAFLRDIEGVAEVLQDLGYLQRDVDAPKFARHFAPLLHSVDGTVLRELLSNPGFRFQATYMLLVRCLGMLKTTLTLLTPEETDWPGVLAEHALPILMSGTDSKPRM